MDESVVILLDNDKPVKLDRKCKKCRGTGYIASEGFCPCYECNAIGYKLTKNGEQMKLFVERHLSPVNEDQLRDKLQVLRGAVLEHGHDVDGRAVDRAS